MPPRMLALLASLALLLAPVHAYAAGDVQKGPYLQHLTPSSVDIELELAKPAAVVTVVAPDTPASAKPIATVTSPSAAFQVAHVQGLSPATRYRYSVRIDHGSTVQGSFTTAPAGTSHAPFTFVLYGDNRSDGPAHERVVRAITGETFDFLVHTGDFVIGGGDDAAWQTFFDVEEPLLRDHAIFACIGNHELFDDREAAHFERYFGPNVAAAPTASPAPLYGSFRWGRARFFMLNAFTSWDGPERAWLDGELTKADTEPGIDVRIVAIHHGPYSSGPHGDNQRLLAAHVDDLLVAHHVDLVLSGHDHIYERGETRGLKYIVSGGGGAPLYTEIHPLPSARKVESTYNYVLVTVTDKDVTTLAKRPDGTVIDRCSFAHGGSWLCDPPPSAPAPKPSASAAPSPVASSAPTDRPGCSVSERRANGWGAALFGILGFALWRRRRSGTRPFALR